MKKLMLIILLTFGVIAPAKANPYLTNDVQFDGESCVLYDTQPEAQSKLIEYYNQYRQTNKEIDANKNGIACEHLPGWFSFISKPLWQNIKYTLTDHLNAPSRKEYNAFELTILFNTLPQQLGANTFKFKSIDGIILVNYIFNSNGNTIIGWKEKFL